MFHHSGCVPSLLLSTRPARCGWISRVSAAVLRSRLLPREDGHPVLVHSIAVRPPGRNVPGNCEKIANRRRRRRCSHDHTHYRRLLQSGRHIGFDTRRMPGSLRVKTTGLFPSCEWPLTAQPGRCRALRRMSLDRTDNGRSALVTGTGLHAPTPAVPDTRRERHSRVEFGRSPNARPVLTKLQKRSFTA